MLDRVLIKCRFNCGKFPDEEDLDCICNHVVVDAHEEGRIVCYVGFWHWLRFRLFSIGGWFNV